jgi:hypothetical protein
MQSVVGYSDLQVERVSVRARVVQGGGGATRIVFQPRTRESFV